MSAGAAVSAAICGYIVTRKIQAYADVLKKASENLEARNTEERVAAKAIKQSHPTLDREEVLVCPQDAILSNTNGTAHPDSAFHGSCQPLYMLLCLRVGLTAL